VLLEPSWGQLVEIFHFQHWGILALRLEAMGVLYLFLYSWFFYFCARKTFQFSERFSGTRRTVFHAVVLSALFCTSFLKVNYGSGLVERTKPATAWDILQNCLNIPKDEFE
jgi:hypothetical protein